MYKKIFIFSAIKGAKGNGRVTEFVRKFYGEPFETSYYLSLSQWVLSSWFLLQLSTLYVICVPNHLWSRSGFKFKMEQGISLQKNLDVITYVFYADLEVSKIIGLRFTPLWKA